MVAVDMRLVRGREGGEERLVVRVRRGSPPLAQVLRRAPAPLPAVSTFGEKGVLRGERLEVPSSQRGSVHLRQPGAERVWVPHEPPRTGQRRLREEGPGGLPPAPPPGGGPRGGRGGATPRGKRRLPSPPLGRPPVV
eukprot:522832-Prorocentrum_minimum.AAC.2